MKNIGKALQSLLFVIVGCTGCSDDGSGGSQNRLKGQLMTSGLQGISYKTATQEGVLGKDGTFDYLEGETLSLFIGNLPLVEDVPTHEYISFLEFSMDAREELDEGTVFNGMSTEVQSEEKLASSDYINNISRFIYLMGDTVNTNPDADSPVKISDRTIEQLNEYLATDHPPIDFHVPIKTFEEEDSPANQLLKSICFFPANYVECEVPPTQEEIDAAESIYDEDGQVKEDRDTDILYKEDLEAKVAIIEGSIRSTIDLQPDNAAALLLSDARDIHKKLGTDLYFDVFTYSIHQGDTSTRTVHILSRKKDFTITEMEVVSVDENILIVDQFDPAEKFFTFHSVGTVGQEATLLINIRLENDYRWYQKTFRVLIK